MELVLRIIKAVISEIRKPQSYVIGEKFEQYLRDRVFTPKLYDLLHRTHDYEANRDDYIETSLEPDFLFLNRSDERIFYVEAKYRSNFWDDAVEWCKPYQLKRYKEDNKEYPVFIALGVEGKPTKSKHLFVFPVKKIKYNKLFKSKLKRYEFEPGQPIQLSKIWKMLK